MYNKGYGIIETLAPLHVGASAGEETGNLNLIFRDQFTQTGIIPGSSIRGRFRADMRLQRLKYQKENNSDIPESINENHWYGHESIEGDNKPKDGGTTEAIVKFEYASLVWFPVFCPGQPIVWITCPRLLKRFQLIAGIKGIMPKPYTASQTLQGRQLKTQNPVLFFNLGFMEIEQKANLDEWIPVGANIPSSNLVVVGDNDVAMLHDMGLYRQSRVRLLDDVKKVDTERGSFFNVEALPEGCILVFPIASKESGWKNALKTGVPSNEESPSNEYFIWKEKKIKTVEKIVENTGNKTKIKPVEKTVMTVQKGLYFGGLESIGFGRCQVIIAGGC